MRAVVAGAPVADPRRGEIYEVNFDPAKGREQKGLRPCLVVSSDALNKSAMRVAIVCTLTTKHKPSFLWRTELTPADIEVVDPRWNAQTSYVQTDQLVTLDCDEGRFLRHLANVRNNRKLVEIARMICRMVSP